MRGQGAQAELPFGLAAVTASHALSVGLVEWSSQRVTLIVKIALQQDGSGRLSLALRAPPVAIDAFDPEGNLLSASDFAPYKPACDVYVVEEADGRTDAGRLLLGPLEIAVARGETLGARESTFDAGDPTSARDAWTQPSFDFGSFQSSPKTRRIPWPQGGFDVHLDRGDMRLHAKVNGPFPRASVVAADGALVVARPALVLDTIAIDARAAELVLCFRGLVEDATGALAGCSLRIDLLDGEGNPARHAAYRAVTPLRPGETTPPSLVGPLTDDTTTTTARIGGFDVERTAVAPMATPAARSLPFVGAERRLFPDEPPRPGITLDALRAQVAQEVPPAWEAMEGTVAIRRPAAIDAAIRSADARGPTMPLVAPPPSPVAPPPPPVALPPPPQVALPPSSQSTSSPPSASLGNAAGLPTAAPRALVTEEPSTTTDDRPAGPLSAAAAADTELIATVQREMWKGERALPEILAEHGLTEQAWGALKLAARRSIIRG